MSLEMRDDRRRVPIRGGPMGRANVFEQQLHRDRGHLADRQCHRCERRPEQGKPVRIAKADQRQVIRHAHMALSERLERAHYQLVARGNEGRRLCPALYELRGPVAVPALSGAIVAQ